MIIITIKCVYYKIETILINTENCKASEPHKFRLNLTGKLIFKNPNKNIALASLSMYYTWKNIKSQYNNNLFKISTPTWNETFDLTDGSYSITDIQDYFEFIIKNHETLTEDPAIKVYCNTIKNRIISKIKSGYKLEMLTPETMSLLGTTKKVVDQNKNVENIQNLESVEAVLVHCNLDKNNYQLTSKVLLTFIPNKEFGHLTNIASHSLTMTNTINTKFSFVKSLVYKSI